MLGGPEAERLAEGLVVQMGEEEEKKGVVPRGEESTVVLWAGAADKGMGARAVQGLELELRSRPCFPLLYYLQSIVRFDSNWRACAQFQLCSFARMRIKS